MIEFQQTPDIIELQQKVQANTPGLLASVDSARMDNLRLAASRLVDSADGNGSRITVSKEHLDALIDALDCRH